METRMAADKSIGVFLEAAKNQMADLRGQQGQGDDIANKTRKQQQNPRQQQRHRVKKPFDHKKIVICRLHTRPDAALTAQDIAAQHARADQPQKRRAKADGAADKNKSQNLDQRDYQKKFEKDMHFRALFSCYG